MPHQLVVHCLGKKMNIKIDKLVARSEPVTSLNKIKRVQIQGHSD